MKNTNIKQIMESYDTIIEDEDDEYVPGVNGDSYYNANLDKFKSEKQNALKAVISMYEAIKLFKHQFNYLEGKITTPGEYAGEFGNQIRLAMYDLNELLVDHVIMELKETVNNIKKAKPTDDDGEYTFDS